MTEQDSQKEEDLGSMSLIEHLTELRNRIGIVLIAFIILFFLCFIRPFGEGSFNAADFVYFWLQAPLADILAERGGRMIFTGLHEGFFTQVKVAFFISISITFPLILLQVWRFVAPGLYKNERSAFVPFFMATPILFVMGAAMVYYLVIPLAWDFFLSFEMVGGEGTLPIEVEPRISEYLSLVMRLMFAFGVSFELPVILLLLTKAGIVTASGLARNRKYAILIAFVAAAILTPPDVISQIMLAVPVIVLYEMSIIGARLLNKNNEFKETDD
ncbi:MAG: twin-arginine translocase subunit TatC [Alphaproteobacteria bacterium]|nr:twin-arginine translocase subunit TatC [Alphaproteobacteria bacterium]